MKLLKLLIVGLLVIFGLPYCYQAGLPGYDGSKMICKDVMGGQTCYFYNPDGSLRNVITN
jgi:hypothetical protein